MFFMILSCLSCVDILADDGKVLILKRKQIYALPQSLSKNGV